MKYIYTPAEAVTEIMNMYAKHIKDNMTRRTRYQKGEISTRSKAELEARDAKNMRDLVTSFIKVE
ncbi:MAG: hypothetical protein ACRCVX_14395 [Shewanella sp.]